MDDEISVSGTRRGYRVTLLRVATRNSDDKEMVIYAGSINRDHVHMLVGIPPQLIGILSSVISERKDFP